jgi:hypothetical protein
MDDSKAPSQDYINAFAELAAHSAPKCGECRVAYACCSADQCEVTREFARENFGIVLEDAQGAGSLPFLGDKGCIVPPHLRPICAVHVCGQHLKDDEWTARYWDLREVAGDILEKEVSLL